VSAGRIVALIVVTSACAQNWTQKKNENDPVLFGRELHEEDTQSPEAEPLDISFPFLVNGLHVINDFLKFFFPFILPTFLQITMI
jgi:hypothetical protein